MNTWLRPLPFALFAAWAIARAGKTPIDDAAPNRSAALCAALAQSGITCAATDVTWVDAPGGVESASFGQARAIVRGRSPERPGDDPAASNDKNDTFDLFLAYVRLSPEGHLLELRDVHDLTRTSGADEGLPIVSGNRAAYVVAIQGRPEAVHVLDLDGNEPRAYDEVSRFQRFQLSVADWQRTGQRRGIRRTVYTLTPPPARADLEFRRDGSLEIKEDTRTVVVDPAKDNVLDGVAFARVTPDSVTKPPTFGPWMSDRLRAASWFGDENNQILKVVTFTALELFKNAKAKITGDTGEKDAQEDIAALTHDTNGPAPPTFSDPETGWPPKPLEPYLKPPISGEGQWIALEKDSFITPIPGVSAPFVTTFVRGDPAAPQTRVYVTLWDPRLIALHMEAGTVEPVSATGEAGPGQIPRTPEVIRHVVAGFNGGFQATHGEFGMQADGVLYLPPKPYAATVMELRDGTTAFGAWPKDDRVPDEVLSFRQNMTALVQNDKYNPWGRAWWGGVPPGWHDAIHTTRSGVCLTKENFVAYFWGNDIGPEPLGRAMLAARCAFGIHLDMNPGLAGFEFYNVQPVSSFAPLGRPIQPDWEYEGGFKDLPDFKFRSRRMVKSMGHMLFPRYIHKDARDFFYLTARTVLPGAPIADAGESPSPVDGEGGNWRVKGLPQHGYPYAIAITKTRLGPDAGDKRVRVLRIDPRTVRAAEGEPASDPDAGAPAASIIAAFAHPRGVPAPAASVDRKHHGNGTATPPAPPASETDGRHVWLGSHVFTIDRAGPAGATALADLLAPGSPAAAEARAAVGVSDEDGMLEWVELLPEDKPDAAASDRLLKLLARLGCSSRGLVAGGLRAYLGGSLDIGGQPAPAGAPTVRLYRAAAPGATSFFDTEVVPQSVWFPLQEKRVKWRPTLAPPDKPAASGSAAPGATAAPGPR